MNVPACDVLPARPIVARPFPPPLPASRVLHVAVVGPGHVGSALLAQLRGARAGIKAREGLELRLRAVANRSRMWLDCDDSELEARAGAQTWRPASLLELGAYLHTAANAVIVDCSASEEVVAHYPAWLAAGIHVVTPNKLAMSGPLDRWRDLRAAARDSGACWHYETTVGAGLPVVKTLRELLDTGDDLVKLEGIFSGTLAWLFDRYDGRAPFSECVREAVQRGYAEPDPRDDLDGRDVARKLVILAREAGLDLSLDDVEVESLVPAPLQGLSRGDFMAQLDRLDAPMAQRHARAGSGVLCHVGCLHRDGRASVGLRVVPRDHALANARLTDNVFVFATRRYCENPLVVCGPGAGPEVTAAGVFADLLRVAAQVRA